MLRILIRDLLLPIILFLLARTALRSLFQPSARRTAAPKETSLRDIPAAGELKKDPVCGTYVSAAASITRTIDGKLVHFCSEDCLPKYRAA